jgi:hypothetical protein
MNATIQAPAPRIPSSNLVRRVTSYSPVKHFHYSRAASRIHKELLILEARCARLRKQYVRLKRKATGGKKNN